MIYLNEVLYKLCLHCLSITDGFLPYPSTVLCKCCDLSLYKVQEEIKKLKTQGYVVEDRYEEKTESGPVLLNGYTITDRARVTEEYKKALEVTRKISKDIYGIESNL